MTKKDYILMLECLRERYLDKGIDGDKLEGFMQAMDGLVKALQIDNPHFSLDDWYEGLMPIEPCGYLRRS